MKSPKYSAQKIGFTLPGPTALTSVQMQFSTLHDAQEYIARNPADEGQNFWVIVSLEDGNVVIQEITQ